MAKRDLNLEDILKEYDPNAPKEPEQAAPDAAPRPEQTGTPLTQPVTRPITPQTRKRRQDKLHRRAPADTFKPSDVKKPEVSFINSAAAIEAAQRAKMNPEQEKPQANYDTVVMKRPAPDVDYQPMIRKMSNSTRAKEMQSKKRRRHVQFTYERESPNAMPRKHAEAEQTPSKRKVRVVVEDLQDPNKVPDSIPETFLETPYQAVQPTECVSKAEKTSIDLSNHRTEDPNELDVKFNGERILLEDQPKRARSLDHEEDAKAVRREIFEMRSSLSLRVLVLGLLAVISGYLALADSYSLPIFANMRLAAAPRSYVGMQLLFGLLGTATAASVIGGGIRKLFQLRADCDTLASMTTVSSLGAAAACLFHPGMVQSHVVHIYMPIALLTLLGNTVGQLLIVRRAARNFHLIADKVADHAVVCVENEKRAESLTRGTIGDFPILATMRKTEQTVDFLRYTFSTDLADKFCRMACPIILVISIIVSIFLSILRASSLESTLCFGLSVFSMCFAACACAAITLVANLPLEKGTKKFIKNKAVMLGYQSVDDFYDVNSIMVDASALFPEGSVQLSSIKIFSDTKIDDAILDAASLTRHAGSVMQGLFSNAIVGKEGMLRKVENFAYEESLGLCGWINNKRVLFGSRELMTGHNIEGLPTKTKENELTEGGREAIYLSVSGNLAAMFVVDIKGSKAVRYWLKELEKQEMCVLVRSHDAIITLYRIAKLYDISQEMVKILPSRMHEDFNAETAPVKHTNASMACAGRFPGFVQLFLGAKSIRSAACLGVILQTVSACLGLVIALVYLSMQAYAELSATLFILYHLIWTGVTLLSVGTRRI